MAVAVAMLNLSIMAIVVPAVFATIVMTMDPPMVLGPMALDPNHFVAAVPITRAMAIEWLVTNLDLNPVRSAGGRYKDARRKNREKQKSISSHDRIHRACSAIANTFGGHL